jgi:hypothetical protein
MADTVKCWSEENREAFRALMDGLGHCDSTRKLRSTGGHEFFRTQGNFHLSYLADPGTKVITITAGRPCGGWAVCRRTV